MSQHVLVLGFVLTITAAVQGGAVIELVPDNPGPYLGGETVVVDYMLSQSPPGDDIYLRLIQFDMNASDSLLALNGFIFEWSGSRACSPFTICGTGHEQYPSLNDADGAIVTTVFTASSESQLFQVLLPGDGSPVTTGHLWLILPTDPGVYLLDALNAGTDDPADGSAMVRFGFGLEPGDELTRWTGAAGDITGGTLSLEVIPEPVTLTLLALGGIAALRRRRGSQSYESLENCIGMDDRSRLPYGRGSVSVDRFRLAGTRHHGATPLTQL